MSWIESPAAPVQPFDWGGVALGALFAGMVLVAIVLGHFLGENDENDRRSA